MTELSKAELNRQLKEAKKEVKYYKKIAEETGNVCLRETEALSKLIAWRKKAEEELRESEEKYRTVLETNPDPVVVYDMEGKVIYFNPAFADIFGWSLKERLGKKMDDFVPEDAWPETKMMIQKVLEGERFSGVETSRYTRKGKPVFVSVSGAIYKNRDDQPIGSIISLRDISGKKKLEAGFHRAQKMEAIGTLAGGIAHDFNNLLMGIQGRTSLILIEKDPSHPDFEHLKGIENYIKSAANLTKQLLGFARGGKYEVQSADLSNIVQNQNRMFGRTRKEIIIHEKYAKNLWKAKVDKGQIEQVLLNLYINAWQSMPAGGNLYVQTENINLKEDQIKPYQGNPGKYVKINVTDTGTGMDKKTMDRIFDPFFTTKEMGRGTGLGLASVYGIVKNHGGFIEVDSEKGKGTTFAVFLPALDARSKNRKTRVDEKGLIKGKETILLIDDEDMIRDVGKPMLEELGYQVHAAKCGEDGVSLYRKKTDIIDLVILDLIMPGIGGGLTYDSLKRINPDVKVLLSSGYSLSDQAKKIMDRGCNGFIQKPFNLKNLSQKLRDVLDKT